MPRILIGFVLMLGWFGSALAAFLQQEIEEAKAEAPQQ